MICCGLRLEGRSSPTFFYEELTGSGYESKSSTIKD
jgi:hypothetical protein